MSKKKILIQLDTDSQASVFDAVVAVDAGVDHLLQYHDVKAEGVRGLIHGAMFTRGPSDLQSTAVFVGGSDVEMGWRVAQAARNALFDPFRVSIMHDSNGCNSTAAAAVLSAGKHIDLSTAKSLVLASTGAVGQTVCSLLAEEGGSVYVASRKLARAEQAIANLSQRSIDTSKMTPVASDDADAMADVLSKCEVLFACGAAGAQLIEAIQLDSAKKLVVAIDLNAVPPAGIPGIQVTDQAVQRGSRIDYGALGVGGLKMKIHKRGIQELFSSNKLFIDAGRMMEIGSDFVTK